VRPWCVDVSSGVETDGVKDVAKMQAYVRNAKAVE
jgi:anthranilate synthase/indole-3-glycerol phosphate synthase/phosphoribosylanthranilate isomerase